MASKVAGVKEENDDLITCSKCKHIYNEGERKPKFLPCFHCYCLECIQVSASFEIYIIYCSIICFFIDRAWLVVQAQTRLFAMIVKMFVLCLPKDLINSQPTFMC